MANQLLNRLANINEATGRAMQRSRKSVDVGKYQNISSALGSNTYNPQNTVSPSTFSQLGTITTMPGESTRYEKIHPGIDIANRERTTVPTFVGGTVVDVGANASGWGNYVIIRDPYGNQQRYSHLHKSMVNVGQKLASGQPLGLMGKTGSVYSRYGGDPSHLDYRVKNVNNQYVSPISYVNKYSP